MTALHEAINSLCGTMPGGICNLYDYSYHYYIKLNNIFSSVNQREERHQRDLDSDNGVETEMRELEILFHSLFCLFPTRHWNAYLNYNRTDSGSVASGPKNPNFYKQAGDT